jgi:hypothetical protein
MVRDKYILFKASNDCTFRQVAARTKKDEKRKKWGNVPVAVNSHDVMSVTNSILVFCSLAGLDQVDGLA